MLCVKKQSKYMWKSYIEVKMLAMLFSSHSWCVTHADTICMFQNVQRKATETLILTLDKSFLKEVEAKQNLCWKWFSNLKASRLRPSCHFDKS